MEGLILQHVALSSFVVLAIYAAAQDLIDFTIPNTISVSIAGLFAAFALTTSVAVLPSLGLAALMLVIGFFLFSKGWFGAGDAKFIAAASLWAGPAYFIEFIYLTTAIGAMLSLGILIQRRVLAARNKTTQFHCVPYGVAIAAGCAWVYLRHLGV